MRCVPLGVIVLLIAAVAAPHAGYAGNVLVPKDFDATSPSLPNLGLAPIAPPKPQVAEPASKKVAAQPAAEPLAQKPATGTPLSIDGPVRRDDQTRIIKKDDGTKNLERANKTLSKSLTLAFDEKSYVSERDIMAISQKLGLAPQKLLKACYLSFKGLLKSENSRKYYFTRILKPEVVVGYDGAIKDYFLEVQALCSSDETLPPNVGGVTKAGDRYVVPLETISCDGILNPKVKKVSVLYQGNSTPKCTYY